MTHAMLDLETLGNGPDACIVQIGACFFEPTTGEIGEQFKINVRAESHTHEGGKIDASTVLWWLGQSPEARNSILQPGNDIRSAIQQLNNFLSTAKNIWSHATFDFVIVNETMKRMHIVPSFSYRTSRDIRTLMELAQLDRNTMFREGTHHDALDDAIFQAKYVSLAWQKLKGTTSPKNGDH